LVAVSSAGISGNEVTEIGPAGEFVGDTVGIEVLAPFDRVDVSDNTVRRSLTIPAEGVPGNWFALRIRRPPIVLTPLTNFTIVPPPPPAGPTLPETTRFIVVTAAAIYSFTGRREIVAVRGNLLEAFGAAPAVSITTDGDCAFNENQCLLLFENQEPVVRITVLPATLIVGANHGRRARGVTLDLRVDPKRLTVLGNITSGSIQVNSTALAAPWDGLNVQNVGP
jgi:hypothetical protein